MHNIFSITLFQTAMSKSKKNEREKKRERIVAGLWPGLENIGGRKYTLMKDRCWNIS